MMAEQRAVEAEHARPTEWAVDEKAALAMHFANPSRTPTLNSQGTGAGSTHTYPSSPPRSNANVNPANDPALSSIAAEMRALRAQVARLEGGRGGTGVGQPDDQQEEEMPPAYWTASR